MKLLARTTIIFLIYASVVAVGGTFVYYSVIRKVYYAYVDRTISRRKLRVLKALRQHLRTPADLAFWHRLDHNIEFFPLTQPGPAADRIRERLMYNELTGRMQPYRQLESAVRFQGRPYRLEIRSSLLDSQELLRQIVLAEALIFGTLLIGLLGLQHLLARRLWAPFYQTLAALRAYELDQDQAVALPVSRIPEFRELNATLTQVLRRNQRVYRSQREFAENAAHELQTPLMILRAKLDLLLQAPGLTEEQAGHLDSLLAVTQRLAHLTRSLLLLARLDHQLFFSTEVVDVAAVVPAQLRQLREQLSAADLTLETDLAASVPLSINRTLLDVLVSNLLINAIRHNQPGGLVRVTLTPRAFTVENTGRARALDPAQLFTRFSRQADSTPGGVGLGMAIVAQICETSGFIVQYAYPAAGRHALTVLFE